MENIKKDEWLYEEYKNLKDKRYVCTCNNERNIVGQIIDLNPNNHIMLKNNEGIYIFNLNEIKEVRPIPKITKSDIDQLKEDDIIEVVQSFVGLLENKNMMKHKIIQNSKYKIKSLSKNELTMQHLFAHSLILKISIDDFKKYCCIDNSLNFAF